MEDPAPCFPVHIPCLPCLRPRCETVPAALRGRLRAARPGGAAPAAPRGPSAWPLPGLRSLRPGAARLSLAAPYCRRCMSCGILPSATRSGRTPQVRCQLSPSFLFFLFFSPLPFSRLQLLGRVLQRRELSSREWVWGGVGCGREAGELGRRVTSNGRGITCLQGGSQRSSSGGESGSSCGHGPGESDRGSGGSHRGVPPGLAPAGRAAWGRRARPALRVVPRRPAPGKGPKFFTPR